MDSGEAVSQLFVLVNLIGEYMISMPKRVSDLYDGLPQIARDQIEKRDASTYFSAHLDNSGKRSL
jgi:hypothetical protein